MTRLIKFWVLAGLTSVYLMQAPCTQAGHGITIIPNNLIPNPFRNLINSLTGLVT